MIAVGADHGAWVKKYTIMGILQKAHVPYIDCNPTYNSLDHYPLIAKSVVDKILLKECNFGILLCTTGIGMSIAANRFNGIRAALCRSIDDIIASVEHNNANILVLPATISFNTSEGLTKWFNSIKPDETSRHHKRITLLDIINQDTK